MTCKRLSITLFAIVIPLLSWVQSAAAFGVESGGGVRIVLPWHGGGENALPQTKVQVVNGRNTWEVPLGQGEITERDYVQFGDWQLPLEAGQNVAKFAIVRRREAVYPAAAIEKFVVDRIVPAVAKPRQDVTIRPGKDGRVEFEGVGSEGRRLDVVEMLRSIYSAVEQGVQEVDVPVVPDPPHVRKVGLEDVNVKELIGTGVSDFGGSPANRITNIRVGVARFNGIVIKQGETFSFNHQLGQVDGDHGFEPELVIVGPRTQKEFGGGLCQVSSTMFRAALYSGLPILARRNHSYFVSYYEWPEGPGFDATIYPGSQDMKFTNDTPGDIAVQATIEGTRVYYRFYGVYDGREVDVGAPSTYNHHGAPATQTVHVDGLAPGKTRIREKAHAGFTASFARTVTSASGKTRSETFTSVYQARPQVIETGSSDEPTPTPELFYTGDIN